MNVDPIEAQIRAWSINPRLEKASGTKILEMRKAIRPNQLVTAGKLSADDEDKLDKFVGTLIWDRVQGQKLQIFVIGHDWATAFADAGEEIASEEYRLPYPICLFEMKISERRIGVVAVQLQDSPYDLYGLLEVPSLNGWMYLNLKSSFMTAVNELVNKQIRAICVALESQVAASEVIRAPLKLNKARERRGQPPMPDYRVVQLARRSRPIPLPSNEFNDGETRKSPRLHFRRGHWAHFSNHRTWRKWTLVGEPDLGFIDKHYRL